MRIVIDACREEKSRTRRWSCRRAGFVGALIVELESPQPVDRNGCVVRIEQVPQELSAHGVECGDRSTEPIADQQIMAEESEVLRGQCDPPGSSQPRTVLQALQQFPLRREDIHKTTVVPAIVIGTG